MMRYPVRWCGVLTLPVLLALSPVFSASEVANAAEKAAEQPAAEAPALPPDAPIGTWNTRVVDGVEYVPLEDVRGFYKLMPLQPKGRKVAGQRVVGNGEVELRFGPEPRELLIQDRLCMLTYPVQEDSTGDLLISRLDLVHVIEPVLRPVYIANRSAVRTVVLDPGHGGNDIGAVTPYVREADVTLIVATKLAAKLRKQGYEVIFTREQNQYLSPQGRVDKGNAAPAAIFVSLHLNSGRSDVKGSQVYTIAPLRKNEASMPGHEFSQCSMALAMALQSALVEKAETEDGGCRRAFYSPLNSLRCPGVMVEMGYATHPEEGTRLNTEEYQIKLADALALGIDNYARVMNPATVLQVQKTPEVEAPAAPVKVTPAPAKKAAPAKKNATPRKRAPRRRAPARRSSKSKKRSR